jgi:hypothetical protein
MARPVWGGRDSLPSFLAAPLCKTDGVQRDIQFPEQMGQGPRILPGLRRGRIVLCADGLPKIEAQQGAGLQFVFQKSDFRDAAPYSEPSTVSLYPVYVSQLPKSTLQLDRFCDALRGQNAAGK